MTYLMNYPIVLSLLTLFAMSLAAWFGSLLPGRQEQLDGDREDFGVVRGAALTLLALVIGFTFSMAVSRYDQRKNLEEEEANAIGTEYVRAGMLAAPDANNVHALLLNYLDQRVRFYEAGRSQKSDLEQINAVTAQLQNKLWSAASAPAAAQPTPVTALVASGMNDVLNAQGYTQAAWWNRIPVAAWALLAFIAFFCNLLMGFGAHRFRSWLLWVLPLLVAISFLLIADIDSPRGGFIRVPPLNLINLAQSLRSAKP